MAIGAQSEDTISPRQVHLQKSICQFASGYLQGNMIAMVPLPSEEQLQALQEEKKRIQAERTRREREEAQQAAERVKQMQLQQQRKEQADELRMSDMKKLHQTGMLEMFIKRMILIGGQGLSLVQAGSQLPTQNQIMN